MTEKRFQVTDNTDNPFLCDWSVTDYADGGIVDHPMTSENMANVMCNLLNELHEENNELKEVITEVFEMITNLDYVRKQYLNALLNILGEENDVDKTKKRIKVFLE